MVNVNLMKGDCLELMKSIPDCSVDLILTDPPYGTTQCKWDSVIPFDLMWEQLKRIIKPDGAIVLFSSQPFTSVLITSNLKMYRYNWVWVKHAPTNFATANRMPMKYHEDICVFYKKQPTYNKQMIPRTGSGSERTKYKVSRTKSEHIDLGKKDVQYSKDLKNPSTVLYYNGVYKNTILHPTQKPVALLEYLIKTYTNENETVLDFTFGSCSTGVACVNTNRKFLGVEMDEDYFNIGVNRMQESIIKGEIK